MCMSEMPFGQSTSRPAPNYCRNHPKVDLGRYIGLIGCYPYQFYCAQCFLKAIEDIPAFAAKNPTAFNVPIDAPTIQAVLDVLYQKWGLTDERQARLT